MFSSYTSEELRDIMCRVYTVETSILDAEDYEKCLIEIANIDRNYPEISMSYKDRSQVPRLSPRCNEKSASLSTLHRIVYALEIPYKDLPIYIHSIYTVIQEVVTWRLRKGI